MPEILFINSNATAELRNECNGTLLLGTRLLEAGFSVDILRFWQVDANQNDYHTFVSALVERILDIGPKCVSFYSLWPQYHLVIRAAQMLKERRPELLIVFGGPQPSATAMETMEAVPWVDYVCAGEGENTIVPFFTALLRNGGAGLETVPGVHRRVDGRIIGNEQDVPLMDLDSLPRWDMRLLKPLLEIDEPQRSNERYWMHLDVGRGCPYGCTFCATSKFWRRVYRLKSPKKIVDDIEYFIHTFGITSFSFNHDAFTANKTLAAAVCDEILARGLKITWKCTTRVDCIDEELILKMKQAGLRRIELGVETGSPRMQKIIRKNLNLDRLRKTVPILVENKLDVALMFMYGFPEETEEDLAQTLDLIFEMIDQKIRYVSMSYCHFCPGTAMTNQYYDDLVLESSLGMMERTGSGYEEEWEMLRQNKALFPFRYHLHTPVRDEYQYVHFLVLLCFFLPRVMGYLRQLYGKDDLRLYRDFYRGNRQYLDEGYEKMAQTFKRDPVMLLENTLKNFDEDTRRKLVGITEFEVDLWKMRKVPEGTELRKIYSFSYADHVQKRPLERFMPGSTEILLSRKNGKLDLQVLRFLM